MAVGTWDSNAGKTNVYANMSNALNSGPKTLSAVSGKGQKTLAADITGHSIHGHFSRKTAQNSVGEKPPKTKTAYLELFHDCGFC